MALLLGIVVVVGGVATLLLRQRIIQPESVIGTQVSEECLNGILLRLGQRHNVAEAL